MALEFKSSLLSLELLVKFRRRHLCVLFCVKMSQRRKPDKTTPENYCLYFFCGALRTSLDLCVNMSKRRKPDKTTPDNYRWLFFVYFV